MTSQVKQNKWVVFVFLLFAGICFSMNNFKVPTNMLDISESLHASFTLVGNLMTMTGIAGIVLTLPAGALVKRFGPRKIGIIGAIVTLIGSIISALATNIYVLLCSRFIEAIGFAIIPVVATTVITLCFEPQKRGLPNGIWSCYIAIGMVCIFNASTPLGASFGYRGSFWLAVIMMALAVLALFFFVRIPKADDAGIRDTIDDKPIEKASSIIAYKTPSVWMLALLFMAFAFFNMSVANFYPTYMQAAIGLDPASANAASSAVSIGGIIAAIIIGFIMNAVPQKHYPALLMIISIASAITAFMLFRYTDAGTIALFTIVAGVIMYLIPPIVFSIAPRTVDQMILVPVVVAIINFAQHVSGFLNGVILSPLAEASLAAGGTDWSAQAVVLAITAAAMIVGGVGQFILLRKRGVQINSHECESDSAEPLNDEKND